MPRCYVMRSATIDAARGHVVLLHRRCSTSIPSRSAASYDPLTQSLSLYCVDRRLHTLGCTHVSRTPSSAGATNNLRQLKALVSRLDQDRTALEEPINISSRTPSTISTDSNAADKIERHLRADGHRIWGLVVYRCTYTSNPEWESCIQHINASVRKSMDLYNGHDMLQEGCFKLTVISDPSIFDGASTQVVRRHFREWCARMVDEEQGSREEVQSRQQQAWPWDWGLPVRYGFCIQVDEASMRSVNSEEGEGWVKLIKGDWKPREATRQQRRQQQHQAGPGGMVESQGKNKEDGDEFIDIEDNEEYLAVEGCTDEDVGWMKVRLVGLMPDFYANLRDSNLWHIQYVRPPGIATA